jgi:hypothetical protein
MHIWSVNFNQHIHDALNIYIIMHTLLSLCDNGVYFLLTYSPLGKSHVFKNYLTLMNCIPNNEMLTDTKWYHFPHKLEIEYI